MTPINDQILADLIDGDADEKAWRVALGMTVAALHDGQNEVNEDLKDLRETSEKRFTLLEGFRIKVLAITGLFIPVAGILIAAFNFS